VAVIRNYSLCFGTGSSESGLLALLRSKIISEDMLAVVANQMLGWTKSQIDALLEQGQAAIIPVDLFNAELLAFVRKFDRFAILNSLAAPPDAATVDLELRSRLYIRQLEIIGSDYDSKLRAANDYLRASVNRSIWASKGLVHSSSFDDFEETLVRTWTARRELVSIQWSEHAPEDRGRLLYSNCCLVDAQLDGRPVPPHFAPGCYHALAEQLMVGWHPQFQSLLTPGVEEEAQPKK
jgi:hypothetical protein